MSAFTSTELITTAAEGGGVSGIGPLVAGLAVVALLIGMVRLGIHKRRTKPRPPRPEEQPRRPTPPGTGGGGRTEHGPEGGGRDV
ncbi:DUF6479 family protein [Streptomyces sp. NPDC006798]|uniref:DUF6479 family protein n=1 Tax=Streptomyces sp. NPDC006798 TaxID=3155462 RepID=UPI0033D0009F